MNLKELTKYEGTHVLLYFYYSKKLRGNKLMVNKVLSKLANSSGLAKGVVIAGVSLSTISNLAIFAGVYYLALRKGVELRDEYYESEESNYEQNS